MSLLYRRETERHDTLAVVSQPTTLSTHSQRRVPPEILEHGYCIIAVTPSCGFFTSTKRGEVLYANITCRLKSVSIRTFRCTLPRALRCTIHRNLRDTFALMYHKYKTMLSRHRHTQKSLNEVPRKTFHFHQPFLNRTYRKHPHDPGRPGHDPEGQTWGACYLRTRVIRLMLMLLMLRHRRRHGVLPLLLPSVMARNRVGGVGVARCRAGKRRSR